MRVASSQTLALGRETDRVEATLNQWASGRVIARLWDHDASLWTHAPATQEAIRRRLGWLSIPRVMAQQTPALRAFAQDVRRAQLTHALVLGMGGSSLFAEVCRNIFGVAPDHVDLSVLDTTDPTAIRSHQQRCQLERLCVIVSSKSGTTSEVEALSTYFYEAFRSAGGDPGSHCLAITDAGTPLEERAQALNFRRTFLHGPDSGMEVGGRFSALTYFGLVPAALLGVDLDRLLARATAMLEACRSTPTQGDNPAAELAAVLGSLGQSGRDKVVLAASPALEGFGTWVEQLIAESLGKSGTGLVPIIGESPQPASRPHRDAVCVELQLASEPDAATEQHVQALEASGVPIVRIRWRDRYDLGGEIVKWEVATALTAHVMGVNAFDEPNVQESKDRTKAILSAYAQSGRLDREEPLVREEGIELFGGPPPGSGGGLKETLAGLFKQRRPQDYCAILSFLPRTEALDAAARALRQRLGQALAASTMLGFGPRYLHSTGQLYKGGADGGIFLLLTAEEGRDLDVPGEPYTFGVLKAAQALGDFQAMRQRRRRMLRIHLGPDPERGMQRLLDALEEVRRRGVA